MDAAITIDAAAAVTIRQHGRETYPDECCGALIGRDGLVERAFALPNSTEEGPRRRFLVRPADYRLAEQVAAGAELVGFYHSHPDHPARPSQYDLEHAWPNFIYVIVSIVQGRAADMMAWKLNDARSSFDAQTVVELPAEKQVL
jgi:proteasome lid subunit RPN8/RPN11